MRVRTAILTIALVLPAVRGAGKQPPETPRAAACPSGRVEATVALEYDARRLGDVAGIVVEVGYPARVSLPGRSSDASLRARVHSLLGPSFQVAPVARDTDGDGRDDELRLVVATSDETSLSPTRIARLDLDCDKGADTVSPDQFRCRTDQVVDGAGELMRPAQAREVGCRVLIENGAATPPTPGA